MNNLSADLLHAPWP